MSQDIRKALIEYLRLTGPEFDKNIDLREDLMKLEHQFYSDWELGILAFYMNSSFLIYSHYQDELERDQDVDWDEMVQYLKATGRTKFTHVLDFGCGIGSAGLNLQERMPCKQVNFYEPNDKSANFIYQRYSRSQIKIIRDRKHVFDTKYDLIIAWGVFEHLKDDVAAGIFIEMLESLTETGKIFLKNFYSDTADYRFHYVKGPKIKDLFKRFEHKIIYANNSDK